MRRGLWQVFLLMLPPFLVLMSCMPERSYIEEEGAGLEFNLDTLFFDTVFTQVGTVTRSFLIHNPHRQFIRIDELELAGGAASVFRMNVDGQPGIQFYDLEIAPRDSMYLFVEATLDPNGSNDILRIQDSIVFSTNGRVQDIDLVAWGQDVHLLNRVGVTGTEIWTSAKPYLILDYLYVDTLAHLRMEAGTRVYLHKNAMIYVDGSLQMDGSLEEPIILAGDRLEEFYQDKPGQWGLVYLSALSHDNRIDYAEIRNGTLGVLISAPPGTGLEPDLEISNTVINRMSSTGLYALHARIRGSNLVIGDCGGGSLALYHSGDYRFNHSTFANYWPTGFSNRQIPAVLLTDYFGNLNAQGVLEIDTGGNFTQAVFSNSIIYGSQIDELLADSYNGKQLNYVLDHCLLKASETSLSGQSGWHFSTLLRNQDPLFDTIPVSYELDTLSPAIDAGLADFARDLPLDFKGESRLEDEAPDLGAFERVD